MIWFAVVSYSLLIILFTDEEQRETFGRSQWERTKGLLTLLLSYFLMLFHLFVRSFLSKSIIIIPQLGELQNQKLKLEHIRDQIETTVSLIEVGHLQSIFLIF